MTVNELQHLADEQLASYRGRALSAHELLAVDDHIAGCASCRERLYEGNQTFAAGRALRAELSTHLAWSEIVACSEGEGRPEQVQHLRECPGCQGEVQELSRFRTELIESPRGPIAPPAPWLRYRIPIAAAAAVLVIVAGVTLFLRHRKSAPAATTVEHADPSLPPDERQMVELALASKRIERAPVLDSLIRLAAPAIKAPGDPLMTMIAPVGAAVISERPVFSWTPFFAAVSYTVTVFDEQGAKVAESPLLTGGEWRPPAPLPRGQPLKWQVTARTKTGTLQVPLPGAPESRFLVLPQAELDRIETIRREHPGDPLLVALLYARAGAIDEAEAVLRLLDPGIAQPYLESVRKFRRPE